MDDFRQLDDVDLIMLRDASIWETKRRKPYTWKNVLYSSSIESIKIREHYVDNNHFYEVKFKEQIIKIVVSSCKDEEELTAQYICGILGFKKKYETMGELDDEIIREHNKSSVCSCQLCSEYTRFKNFLETMFG